jgi:hypothetical protein
MSSWITVITPLHALKMVLRDTGDNLFTGVEQITTVTLGRLPTKPPSFEAPVSGIGSSNSHTAAQASHARSIMEDKIGKLPHRQPVIFTDGSVLSNPGPCRAATNPIRKP